MGSSRVEAERVRQAAAGCEESLARLCEQVRPRVRAYVFRVTLDHELAEDVAQDVLLQMVKSLGELRNPERFWPWVYRIALNRVRSHYGRGQRAEVAASVLEGEEGRWSFGQGRDVPVEQQVAHRELAGKVFAAMERMKHRQRAVLSLRCFEQLSYAEIGESLGCTEMTARVMFCRARRELVRVLKGRGVEKSCLVLALTLFGRMTAGTAEAGEVAGAAEGAGAVAAGASGAGVTVGPGMLSAGVTAAVVATVATKVGLAALAAVLVGAGVTAYGVRRPGAEAALRTPARGEVRSVHYTEHSPQATQGPQQSLSKGAYEQWYELPEGPDGPVFFAMQRWGAEDGAKLCCWLQDEAGNFYYHSGEKRVYASNGRIWRSNLRTWRLPWDEPELHAFLDEVEGSVAGVEYQRDRRTGLLARGQDQRFVNAENYRVEYEYNAAGWTLGRPWPGDPPVVDERDAMHRRGWGWFRVRGEAAGQAVSGYGRAPFVYEQYHRHGPVLEVRVDGEVRAVDDGERGCVAQGGRWQVVGAEELFVGLARPWMGLHTVDLLRRQAARERLRFATGETVQGLLMLRVMAGTGELWYAIDMEDDLLRWLEVRQGGRVEVRLEFEYLEEAGPEGMGEPAWPMEAAGAGQGRGTMTWPMRLKNGV